MTDKAIDSTNGLPQAAFGAEDVKVSQRQPAFQGFFAVDKLSLQHRLYQGGWSQPLERELFVRGAAVGVLLYDPHHDLIGLVEQFRVGALQEPGGPWCLEVVAGIIEDGESPQQVAERELQEETSLSAGHWEFICDYLSSPGGSDEKLHLFCAQRDLRQAGGVHGLDVEGEDIKVHALAADTVFVNLYGGRFNNAATLIALQWLQHNRPRLRAAAREPE